MDCGLRDAHGARRTCLLCGEIKFAGAAFALYEVLIGLTIFVVGVLALGRSVENCMNASVLSAQEDRVRQVLANRMAEVQATPGPPDAKKEIKVTTNYGEVRVLQQSLPAGLKDDKETWSCPASTASR